MPYSILFGAIDLQFPAMPWLSVDFDQPALQTLLYLGMAHLAYKSVKFLACSLSRMSRYLRSFSNGNKFLYPKSPAGTTYTAVIYGASTKVGKCYAHYLAKKGFNLILIERDIN